jgi:urease accessory protein
VRVPALGLAESQADWQAELDLSFVRRGEQTVLSRNQHRGPLQVQKALYPEGKDTCHIAVLHPPGGVAAGDRLGVRVSLGEESRALLTTPGRDQVVSFRGRLGEATMAFGGMYAPLIASVRSLWTSC